jgi:hypothetical protein
MDDPTDSLQPLATGVFDPVAGEKSKEAEGC